MFAEALGTTVEYLMGWNNVPHLRIDNITPEELDLIACFRRADERDRNTVRNVLERYQEDTSSAVG